MLQRLLRWVLAELKNVFPAWLYLFLSFSLLRLTVVVALRESGVDALPPSRTLFGSLVVAKALVTVDTLKLFPKLDERPVLIASLFRTFLYAALVAVYQGIDVLLEHRREGWAAGANAFADRLETPRFWVLELWLVVLLLGFSVTRTFSRKLGRERFLHIMIGPGVTSRVKGAPPDHGEGTDEHASGLRRGADPGRMRKG